MFFLCDLPTEQMVSGYLDAHSSGARHGEQRRPEEAAAEDAQKVLGVLRGLRAASLLIRRLDEYFQSHGLSQLRFLILVVIDREPGSVGLTPSEIAKRLDVSKPVLSRTLERLRADGLIAFEASDKDSRKKLYRLQMLGEERLAKVMPGYLQIIKSAATQSGGDASAFVPPPQAE